MSVETKTASAHFKHAVAALVKDSATASEERMKRLLEKLGADGFAETPIIQQMVRAMASHFDRLRGVQDRKALLDGMQEASTAMAEAMKIIIKGEQ